MGKIPWMVWGRGNKSGLWTVFCLITALFFFIFSNKSQILFGEKHDFFGKLFWKLVLFCGGLLPTPQIPRTKIG